MVLNRVILISAVVFILISGLFLYKFESLKKDFLKEKQNYVERIYSRAYDFEKDKICSLDKIVLSENDKKSFLFDVDYTVPITVKMSDFDELEKLQSVVVSQTIFTKKSPSANICLVFSVFDKNGNSLKYENKDINIPSDVLAQGQFYNSRFFIPSELLNDENEIKFYYWNRGGGEYIVQNLAFEAFGVFE